MTQGEVNDLIAYKSWILIKLGHLIITQPTKDLSAEPVEE